MGYSSHVRDWYVAADVVVVPTRKEGLARCMIESLACATPVISFDVCSAREILENNGCGLVSRQGDYEQLVAEMSALLRSAEARVTLGGRGVEVAHRLFSRSAADVAYRQLLKRIVNPGLSC